MKTLYIDIETSPNVADVWALAHGYISINQLKESSRMLCFAAKWKDEKKPLFFSEWDDGTFDMVWAAKELLNEADVVVHYNGHSFDVPIIRQEMADLNLSPFSPFQEIDLLKIVRRQFRYPSNKLQYVAGRLLGESKVAHEGHSLWTKVLNGDKDAQTRFRKYCIKDTLLLEPLHDFLIPWAPTLPNQSLYSEGAFTCPKCAGGPLVKEGFSYTQLGKYQRYSCSDCGGWSTDTRRVLGTQVKGV